MPGILITGATGQVGGALLPALAAFGDLLTPNRRELDLASADSIRGYVRATRPRWIVNPAAYTAVDQAESEPELAHAINAEAPRLLGEEALRVGASVVHFSTDYVFDGKKAAPYVESDEPAPQSVYGRTKLAGERALAATGAPHLILRTSWVYGAVGRNFLRTVLRLASERPEMNIVADQHGAPTWSHDLARLTAHLLALDPDLTGQGGVYHATSSGETTWHGFASEALRLARVREPAQTFAELRPVASHEYPTAARRPVNSRLDCGRLERAFHFSLPAWEQSLADVLALMAHGEQPWNPNAGAPGR